MTIQTPLNDAAKLLKYANLQIAAEAMFDTAHTAPKSKYPELGKDKSLEDILVDGNAHSSRFSETTAKEFTQNWEIVEHISNTETGLSGTLFRSRRR